VPSMEPETHDQEGVRVIQGWLVPGPLCVVPLLLADGNVSSAKTRLNPTVEWRPCPESLQRMYRAFEGRRFGPKEAEDAS